MSVKGDNTTFERAMRLIQSHVNQAKIRYRRGETEKAVVELVMLRDHLIDLGWVYQSATEEKEGA